MSILDISNISNHRIGTPPTVPDYREGGDRYQPSNTLTNPFLFTTINWEKPDFSLYLSFIQTYYPKRHSLTPYLPTQYRLLFSSLDRRPTARLMYLYHQLLASSIELTRLTFPRHRSRIFFSRARRRADRLQKARPFLVQFVIVVCRRHISGFPTEIHPKIRT